ncbi:MULTISPECIES: hypothetical protein [unclassified Streptomyces]|uniref:hypothetical protein n=1 Tax=unclassified Streptomyces TaxID=2593676 RepID=UPI00069473EA|nr:hypothetical protein [Streptomyces sp. NBC_00370]
MNAIGPVESASDAQLPLPVRPQAGDILDAEPPLPPATRWRRVLLVTGCALVVVLAVANTLTRQPRSAVTPAPLPGDATRISYAGPVGAPDPGSHTFSLRVTVTTAAGPPLTVEEMQQPFTALTTTTLPETPFTLTEHHSRRITLRIRVDDCAGTPAGFELPFLDVTLRNKRAIQKQTFVLSRTYAADVSAAIRTICRPSVP